MFEQEYTRANDRIHPRKELLQELEAKWAAEQAQQAEESLAVQEPNMLVADMLAEQVVHMQAVQVVLVEHSPAEEPMREHPYDDRATSSR